MAANETWARLHSDPLFAIRQQEQSARKQVVANPAQMQAIKKQVCPSHLDPTRRVLKRRRQTLTNDRCWHSVSDAESELQTTLR